MTTLDSVRAHQILAEARELAEAMKVEFPAALASLVLDRLDRLQGAVVNVEVGVQALPQAAGEDDSIPTQNVDWIVFPIQIEISSTPKQGPDIAVPTGKEVVVRQRRHSTVRTGYVAPDEGRLANTLTRTELGNNDSFKVAASNLNKFWFDADTDNTFFELMVEQIVKQ